jgi:hypothetical protein
MFFVKCRITQAFEGSQEAFNGNTANIDGKREAGTLAKEVMCLSHSLRRSLKVMFRDEVHGLSCFLRRKRKENDLFVSLWNKDVVCQAGPFPIFKTAR